MRALILLSSLTLLPSVGLAVDGVTGASRREQPAPNDNAAIWITGRAFAPGLSVTITGNGIVQRMEPVVVPEADRIDGGRGDGINYAFSIGAEATPGLRDITVTGADGSMGTLVGAIEIVGGLTIIDTSPQVATAVISNAFRPV